MTKRPAGYSRQCTFDALLALCTICGHVVCQLQDTVSFISEPRNMTVVEGEAVRFECDFDGSDLTPSWIINNSVYYHTDLPHPYLFNNQDFSLTIEMVSLLLSGTTFRCIVGRTESVEGLLVVIKAYSHHDHSSQDSTVTVSQHSFIQPPKEILVDHGSATSSLTLLSATSTVTDDHEELVYETKSSESILLLVSSAIVAFAFTMCLFLLMIVVAVRSCVLHKKQGKGNNITITEMNDAYGVLDNRLVIEKNPAYEALHLYRHR